MTTRVTVDAHAGWPVKVIKMELTHDRGTVQRATEEIVPPGETRDFYVYSHMKISVEEVPHK